jgi:hypothetical protein
VLVSSDADADAPLAAAAAVAVAVAARVDSLYVRAIAAVRSFTNACDAGCAVPFASHAL